MARIEQTLEEYLDILRTRTLQDERMINEWLKEQLREPWRIENYAVKRPAKAKGATA